ncbi:MAG TPA: MgtC/SapB family protein [Rhizomicrobium sp.]|jgi:uncharacterized membrane protein (DUF4010 family)|nr:MgtC/SapB family protein [Rhizomicrobium sp.]
MTDIALLQRAGLAVAIGLLIGIERGWQSRQARDGARVAGIRTFTLIGGFGGICGLVPGNLTLGLCFVGFALPFGLFEWRRAQRAGIFSATDFVAGLMTFMLGAYAARGSMAVAGAGGVVTAAILAERKVLHTFLQRLKWSELRAALVLLAMTAVLLPVLPDRTVDPWQALNPHQIWLMTVLVGAVCYAGYIAVRVAGERRGLLFAGLMGGLATSTTVTWTFARMVGRNPAALPQVMTAILAAWMMSLMRMTVLAVVIAPSLLRALAPPMAAASAVLLIPALLAYRAAGKAGGQGLTLTDPFELPLMLRFTALLCGIMLLVHFLSSGTSGLFALGGISGLLDVDPITLSMAKAAGGEVTPAVAVSTILIAATANGVAKSVLAVAFGGARLGLALSGFALLAFGAGAAVFALV